MKVIRLTSLADDMDEVLRPREPEYVHHVGARGYLAPAIPPPPPPGTFRCRRCGGSKPYPRAKCPACD